MLNIFLSIVIIGASAGLFFMKTAPVLDRITSIKETRVALSVAEKSSEQFQEILKEKNEVFNQIDDSKKTRLKKFLPDSMDNVRLIIDINQIASDNSMTIRNISIRGSGESSLGPDTRPYGMTTLGFSVSGPYQTFKKFLEALEMSLRLVDVTSLSFSAGDKDQYEYNLEVRSYWLK